MWQYHSHSLLDGSLRRKYDVAVKRSHHFGHQVERSHERVLRLFTNALQTLQRRRGHWSLPRLNQRRVQVWQKSVGRRLFTNHKSLLGQNKKERNIPFMLRYWHWDVLFIIILKRDALPNDRNHSQSHIKNCE